MINTTVAGRLGKDAEIRQAGSTNVCSFSVAADVGYGERKQTIWFDCSLFGKRGEALAQHLTKGSSVTVNGEFSQREYEGRTYNQLKVSDITLQGGKRQDSAPSGSAPNGGFQDDDPSSIPF